jgi:hypothetical protein
MPKSVAVNSCFQQAKRRLKAGNVLLKDRYLSLKYLNDFLELFGEGDEA